VLNIFVKAARTLASKSADASAVEKVREAGVQIIKAIEKECEKDKAMSNLKGKIKEIQHIVKQA
jgi:hypothetical protein